MIKVHSIKPIILLEFGIRTGIRIRIIELEKTNTSTLFAFLLFFCQLVT